MEKAEENNVPYETFQRIEEVFGRVITCGCEAPGVYYAHTAEHREYYLVEWKSPVISEAAKEYGKINRKMPEMLYYSFDEAGSGSKIVEYELKKYAISNQLPDQGDSLQEIALYGMEKYPEYFGTLPTPVLTPWGRTIRYWSIENGIIWLETDRLSEGLAIAKPIWDGDISGFSRELGKQEPYQDSNDGEYYGYLFFEKKDACIVFYELLMKHHELIERVLDLQALMNAIYQNHPEYVVSHNVKEHMGKNDVAGQILERLGTEIRATRDKMITLFPETGTEYLPYWDKGYIGKRAVARRISEVPHPPHPFLLRLEKGEKVLFSEIMENIPQEQAVLDLLFPSTNKRLKHPITPFGLSVLQLRLEGITLTQAAKILNSKSVANWWRQIFYKLSVCKLENVEVDIPALREALGLPNVIKDPYTKLSQLLESMPSDEELHKLEKERGFLPYASKRRTICQKDLMLLNAIAKGKSYRELAQELGKSANAIRNQIVRIRRSLVEDLKVELDIPGIFNKPR